MGRLTFSGQHGDADARVAEFNEGQAACGPVLLSDKDNVLSTNISMNQVLILLWADSSNDITTESKKNKQTQNNLFEIGCVLAYQVEHGPGQLLGHLQLPGDVHGAFVLFQVGVERTELAVLLHHHV